jgi:magnesium-transporting ATPase (P-type)
VICTDKTGTLTENKMRVTASWTPDGDQDALSALTGAAVACNTADLFPPSSPTDRGGSPSSGDPTELALLGMAVSRGADVALAGRQARRKARRKAIFRFDPRLKLMSTVDAAPAGGGGGERLMISVKGAPEAVLAKVAAVLSATGERPVTSADRDRVAEVMEGYGEQGLRVLAFARRALPAGAGVPATREEAESGLCLIGLTAMQDPPRAEVPGAIARVHRAGIRVHVVTGDNGVTAAAIARRAGIGGGPGGLRVVNSASPWAAPAPTWPARRPPWCSPTTISPPSRPRWRRDAGSMTTSASSSATSSPTPSPRSCRS